MSSKMKKVKYQKCFVESCFNPVIELIQRMLILIRFVEKKFMSGSRKLILNIFKNEKIKYQTCRMWSCSNHVIELNLKMLISKRFVTKNDFFHIRIKKTDVEYFQK
jgi:hypothetical protein